MREIMVGNGFPTPEMGSGKGIGLVPFEDFIQGRTAHNEVIFGS